MKSIIILLGVIVVFLGFIGMMMCGVYSMLHEIKKSFRNKADNTDDEI